MQSQSVQPRVHVKGNIVISGRVRLCCRVPEGLKRKREVHIHANVASYMYWLHPTCNRYKLALRMLRTSATTTLSHATITLLVLLLPLSTTGGPAPLGTKYCDYVIRIAVVICCACHHYQSSVKENSLSRMPSPPPAKAQV